MPLKRGPHGSYRHYSSSTGRYTHETAEARTQAWLLREKNKPLTKEQKRNRRTEWLEQRAMMSKDPYLYDVFKFIESRIPHYILNVNQNAIEPNSTKFRELDLVGKSSIIEIKSGKNAKYMTQLTKLKEIADKRKIKLILYAPHIKYNQKQEALKTGAYVVTNKEELYKEIKKCKI